MSAMYETPHTLRPATFSALLGAQVEAADVAGAARTLTLACVQMEGRGWQVPPPLEPVPGSKRQQRLAAATRAPGAPGAAAGAGEPNQGANGVAPESSLTKLSALAVQATLPSAAEATGGEAEGEAEGEADTAKADGAGEGEAGGEAGGEGDGAAELTRVVVDLLTKVDSGVRAAARDSLSARGIDPSSLDADVAAALARP